MDYQHNSIKSSYVRSNGLTFLLFDGLKVVRVLLSSPIDDKMDSKGLDQLSERVNRSRLQTRVPMLGCPLQSGGESWAQDSIGGFLKEHNCLKAVDMIGGICDPVVALQLKNLEVWWDRFLKDARHERQFRIEPVGWC